MSLPIPVTPFFLVVHDVVYLGSFVMRVGNLTAGFAKQSRDVVFSVYFIFGTFPVKICMFMSIVT